MTRRVAKWVVFAGFLWCGSAEATILRGVIRYQRNWADCSNVAGARAQCSTNGAMRGVQGMVISVVRAGGGETSQGVTDGSGNYSVVVNGGASYSIRLLERDGSLSGGGSTFGTSNLAIVSSTTVPQGGFNDVVAVTATLPTGNVIVTNNIDIVNAITPGTLDRINTYQMLRMQQAIWENQGRSMPSSLYKIRVVDGAPAGTSIQCDAPGGSDCVATITVSLSRRDNGVLWHEVGHGLHGLIMNFWNGEIYRPGSAACPGSSGTDTASFALQEGWADFVQYLTKFPPSSIPANFNGGICNSCLYAPTGNQPSPPACGSGSVGRDIDSVAKALVELVDSTPADVGCRPESLQLSLGTLLDAWTFFGTNTCGCGNRQCGIEEGGAVEGNESCAVSTPNWPYTGSNALPVADQSGLLDYLGVLKAFFGVSGTALRDVWANSCWQASDSATRLP